ncbi:hypothetical protein, partial [Serratia marcescens]|uniref:hypothetical protein n=1 Tax=Serratia marcescens TaxID=615 RepID=UPI00404552C8
VKISYAGTAKFGDNNFRHNYLVSGDPFSALAQGKSGRRVGAERYFATIFTQKCSTTCETPDCERFW